MKNGIIIVALGLVIFGLSNLRAQNMTTVMNATGSVTSEKDGKIVNLKKGDKIATGAKILTKADGMLALMLAPGANIMVAPNSSLQITKIDAIQSNGLTRPQKIEVLIESGSIVTDFAPGDKDANITVKSNLASLSSSGCTAQIQIGSFIVQMLSGSGVIHFNNQNFDIITNQYFDSSMSPLIGDLNSEVATQIAQFMNNALGGYVAGLFGETPLPTFSVLGGNRGHVNTVNPNISSPVSSSSSQSESTE